jgi:hypothetical protein
MNKYEAKKEARIQRFRDRAEKARAKSEGLYKSGMDALRVIPLGQPILIGHHSEKADRSYRNRAFVKLDKASAESEKAQYYEGKAHSAESNHSISSDDPDAVEKLRARIEKAESLQSRMVAANKIVRKFKADKHNGTLALEQEGFAAGTAAHLFEPDFMGRLGFPDYALQNNNANIRRMKERLATLERSSAAETTEIERNGIRIIENAEENSIQLVFPGKPDVSVRTLLKRNGFRWSPTNGAWQRHLNSAGKYAAQRIIEEVSK